jgi:cell division protein FtsI/penicillin-binding protein 2
LDKNKIYSLIDEIKEEIEKRKITSPKEQYKIIYEGIANYVASGNALNEKGKKILLKENYKGKSEQGTLEKIINFFKPSKFEGEKYFEKASNAYRDMYDILSQDEVAQQKIPELTKAAESMRMYGFLDTALNIFKTHGMMDDKLYKKLSQELYSKTSMDAQKGMKGIEAYIMSKGNEEKEEYSKAAALILGLFGMILIMTNLRMTGAAIGNISNVTLGLLGMGMAAGALLLFLKTQKKKL